MSGERSCYLDASALVKLIEREIETDALRVAIDGSGPRYASSLVRAEVPRAARRHGARAAARAHLLVEELDLIELDDDLLTAAAGVGDAQLRTLDAIHLASALALGDDLDVLITYDHRLADAARELGITVEAPH